MKLERAWVFFNEHCNEESVMGGEKKAYAHYDPE